MSANVASFQDHKVGHLKRQLNQPNVAPRAESILSDMADGNLVTQFFFSFAGFEYKESKLALILIGLIGDGQDSVDLFDEEIAEAARCNERTVQRARADYKKKAQAKNFWLLAIKEGAYLKEHQRYEPTTYSITFAPQVEQAVAQARASSDYAKDRRGALKKAAEHFYDDIVQAPPKLRNKKARAVKTPLAEVKRATEKVSSAGTLLKAMPAEQRRAFVRGQGDELHEAMDRLREQMAELEAAIMREKLNVADKEDSDTYDILSGTPPHPVRPRPYVVPRREEETTHAAPTPEATAVWDRVCASAKHQPQVTCADVEIVASATTEPPPEAPPHELEYVPDAPEPTLTEFDAVAATKQANELLAESSDMKKSPKVTFSEEGYAPPKSKMERDIEEQGGTAHYF
jgi:hypothetical protein